MILRPRNCKICPADLRPRAKRTAGTGEVGENKNGQIFKDSSAARFSAKAVR